MKRLLSGNEAVARGAWEAGCSVGSGYPGTPSTEIMETFALYPNVYAEWAPNEKVGLDVAIGAAYAGKRSISTMKHVGLNVAADAFFYAAMTGIEAGLETTLQCTLLKMNRITDSMQNLREFPVWIRPTARRQKILQ